MLAFWKIHVIQSKPQSGFFCGFTYQHHGGVDYARKLKGLDGGP